jgi:hypothetical protein
MLQYRGLHTSSSSTNPSVISSNAGANNNRHSRSPPCFGNGLGFSASSSPLRPLIHSTRQLSPRVDATNYYGSIPLSSSQVGAFHSASRASRAISAPLLVAGGQSSSIQASFIEEIVSPGWALRAGAVIFAAVAATAGSFLNPIDKLRGNSGGGGGEGPGGGTGGGPGKFEHKFNSPTKKDEDEKAKLTVDVATAPRPYEVSR